VESLRQRLALLGYTSATSALLTLLARIPQPIVPAGLTTELSKIAISVVPNGPRSSLGVPAFLKLILGALGLAAIPTAAFFLLTAPAEKPVGGAQSPTLLAQAGSLHGRIFRPDGTTAPGATVFIALPGSSQTRIRNGVADEIDPGSPQTVTDASGEYSLPPQHGKFLLVALDDAGFVEADQDALAKNGDVRLAAWGRLHGRPMTGTKPQANMQLQAGSIDPAWAGQRAAVSIIDRVQTDADGHFAMDHTFRVDNVPPGDYEIHTFLQKVHGDRTLQPYEPHFTMPPILGGVSDEALAIPDIRLR
jgi:hypothetical protein